MKQLKKIKIGLKCSESLNSNTMSLDMKALSACKKKLLHIIDFTKFNRV